MKWVSYSEGDAILLEGEKIYGFRIPTQVFYDVTDNETNFEIDFNDGATAELAHCLFHYSYDGTMIFVIESQSITLDYDPQVDDYLEIILSDYSSKQWYFGYMMYGIDEVTNFPFGMDLYEEDTPTPQTLQWVTFSNGDTIPSDLQIYGIKGIVNDLAKVFGESSENIYVEDAGRNKFNVIIGGFITVCYSESDIISNTSVEYTFSNVGCSDYYTVSSKTIANMSNDIQLYIYA